MPELTGLKGVLVMNKPQGFTSFDVIGKLRGILKMRRLGHTGTLDPMAEGVLPVLVGTATRACDILPDETKAYRADFRLGTVTDTQDSTGTVLETKPFAVTEAQMRETLSAFTGEIRQIPPMYSAVQVNGKRLYEIARAGKEIERPARTVYIERCALTAFDEASGCGTAEIVCGKGTYVRTVLHDAGQRLGCGACMTALVRTAACGFTLRDAHSFDEVQRAAEAGALPALLIPTDRLFAALPAILLSGKQSAGYQNGMKLRLSALSGVQPEHEIYRIYSAAAQTENAGDQNREFLGLGRADFAAGELRVYKNL